MAARESLDDKLARLKWLRGQETSPERTTELKKRLGDRSNLVVAAAATIIGQDHLVELATDLEPAFDRFLDDPVKDDKLCRAKIAIVEALDRIEHPGTDVFLKAARHIQFEPSWGPPEDSAAPLRAAALIALARIEGTACLSILVDAMADHAKDVRIASAVAMGAIGSEAAGLLLRLKVRLGDRDLDVLSECLAGLLAVHAKEYLPIVVEFLNPTKAADCEAAAHALGKSRLPEALDPLKDCLGRCLSAELRQQILLAIGILRRPAAIDFLLEYLGTQPISEAARTLLVLRIHKDDPRLRDRVAAIVTERDSPDLQASFDRDFG